MHYVFTVFCPQHVPFRVDRSEKKAIAGILCLVPRRGIRDLSRLLRDWSFSSARAQGFAWKFGWLISKEGATLEGHQKETFAIFGTPKWKPWWILRDWGVVPV